MKRIPLAPGHDPADTGEMGTIYLLCFTCRFGHAGHYMGWAKLLDARLAHHRNGTGANLLRHVRNAGIDWHLAATWRGTRNDERRMKNHGHARRCPTCQETTRRSRTVPILAAV